MIERFASCAKSTISIDDEPCQKEACLELRRKCQQLLINANQAEASTGRQDLTSQVERQLRKIALLQKSKQLLAEEVALLKQQLSSKNLKLRRMESIKDNETYRSNEAPHNGNLINYSVIIQQKEQTIELVREQLKSKQKELLDLSYQNNQIKEELTSKQTILDKLRESSKAQLLFYKKQIVELESEIQLKNQEIISNAKLHEDLMRKEITKWEHAVGNYNNKMGAVDKQIYHYKSKIDQMAKAIKALEQKQAETDQLLASEKDKNAWLTRLLEEAKIEFMHSELKKLEKKEKTVKRKAIPLQKHRFFNQSRSYRSTSEASTALASAKTAGEQPSSTPVAPFRLHPQSSQLFRLNPQDSEVFEGDWPNIVELNPFNQS